jgi:hypothetical protein
MNQIYSDFWLDNDTFSNYLPNSQSEFSIDMIQLSSVRRIISNYVDILTGQNIPVFFKAKGDSFNVMGKEIYITTDIRRKKDFDRAVGLALHEATHTVKTDFDAVITIPFKAPAYIWDFCRKHNIQKITMERFLKIICNLIEDWYIDDWVMNRLPGYVGYYEACYNHFHNNQIIDDILLSNEFRHPSLRSYEFRLINFPNPLTDIKALPGLDEIAHVVNISKISRLLTTQDRINIAYEVVGTVLRHLSTVHSGSNGNSGTGTVPVKTRIDLSNFFKDINSNSQKNDQDSTKTVRDIANSLANKPKPENDENKSITTQTSKSADKELNKDAKAAIDKQFHYVYGDVEKEELNDGQKIMLDLIEKHGIKLVYVPFTDAGNDTVFRVPCIVVKKLTMELILAGSKVFPMSCFWKDEEGHHRPNEDIEKSVNKGIQLGEKLGRKLVIRRESHTERTIRKTIGKINRRLLYSAGHGAEDIFERIRIHRYNRGSLHITVDASNSMAGQKWLDTMEMCVAICKATSMVDNIHVTVSFRASHNSNHKELPYVVLAYDSNVDKFSKVKQLFKYLNPKGCTPEGLAFASIMDIFSKAAPDEEDRFFLNISDGEPFFRIESPVTNTIIDYDDGSGVEHTREQVKKIRRMGVSILSYFVEEKDDTKPSLFDNNHDTRKNFESMYGSGAKFIKTNDVVKLAQTINDLFLKKG